GRAPVFPIIALPCFVPRLAGTGDCVEPPSLFAAVRFVSRDEAANTVLAAGHADDHFVLYYEWRERHRVTRGRIGQLVVPDRVTVLRINGYQMRVDSSHEQRIAEDGHTAIHDSAAW